MENAGNVVVPFDDEMARAVAIHLKASGVAKGQLS
jgi:hypothetical protein